MAVIGELGVMLDQCLTVDDAVGVDAGVAVAAAKQK